jgi:hypothetical protein
MSVFRVGSNKSSVNNFPSVRPTLDLDFANSKTLDPRITFTRASGGSYVGADGLIKYAGVNEARFDHDPVTGESLGLLIEESRTNLFKNSSVPCNDGRDVTDVVNGIDLYTITANAFSSAYNSATSPGNSGFMPVQQGLEYVVSFYAKKVDANTVTCRLINSTGGLLTGTGNAAPTFDGGRVSVKLTCTVSGSAQLFLGMSPGLSVEFGGLQIEAGSFPTSYIPTQGSTRTRARDTASITGKNFSGWYRQDEGTVFADFNGTNITSGQFPRIFEFDNGTSSNLIRVQQYAANAVRASVVTATVGQFAADNGSVAVGVRGKTAFGSALNDAALVTNGASPTTDATYLVPIGLTQLGIGGPPGSSSNVFNSTIRRLTYWPVRLPNAQLQALTK